MTSHDLLGHAGTAGVNPPGASLAIRSLTSDADLNACVALQRQIWGQSYDTVPSSVIKVATRIGSIAAGAFTPEEERLVGFVFGLTGVAGGVIVHWSHMLAVTPEAQNRGIGHRLKDFQRARARELGARTIYWTFDPLVARNAHFNLNVLGVHVTEYVRDMYGESTSPLHQGIGTDRFIVAWPVDAAAAGARHHAAPIRPSRGGPEIHVDVPDDISLLQRSDMDSARAWRATTRAQLLDAFAQGFMVQRFERAAGGARGHYVLVRPDMEQRGASGPA